MTRVLPFFRKVEVSGGGGRGTIESVEQSKRHCQILPFGEARPMSAASWDTLDEVDASLLSLVVGWRLELERVC